MSETRVSVDDDPKAFYVLWNTPNGPASENLRDWGFHGLRNVTKEAVLNGNDARVKARAEAIREGCFYGWHGSYDWGVGVDSAVFSFNFTFYSGDDDNLWDGRKS